MADDGFDVCPYAQDGHLTDDPYGGPCGDCWNACDLREVDLSSPFTDELGGTL